MNKIYKVLATTTLLAMAAMPAVSAQAVSPTLNSGQGSVQQQVKVVPGTMGYITDYANDSNGKWITVTGRGLGPADQSEIRLSVNQDTKIIDAKGNKVQLQSIIDKNKAIKAFYSPNITKSLPAQGQALTIIALDRDFTAIDGTISEISKAGILVEGRNLYTSNEETIRLHLDPKAKIIDQNGKMLDESELKAGMQVKSFYGPAVAMSLPPQSTTNYILVNTEAAELPDLDQPAGTTGIITDTTDGTITVIGQALETGGVNYVILTVDEETEIVDKNGAALSRDVLKEDVRIEALYSQVMTLIYPARTHADKIVVSDTKAPKIEGTVAESERNSKEQLYINVGSDSSTNNDVILNISKDTQIIAGLGPDAELAPGTKITAYHSPVMTKSLPPITAAEVIIVHQDQE